MRFLILLTIGVWLALVAICVFAQSEHLDDPVDYESLELRLEGCRHNLPIYFHKCMTKGDAKYSEAQIGNAIKSCNKHAWHRFFDCVELYPRKTLTEQIEEELK
jgi:hypothetical protein